jgi:hypothetical protein
MHPHIDWNGDCLTIEEQGQKADQTGEDKFPKHVYANPLQPVLCPILAIAVLVFSCSSADSFANRQLFCGTDSKGRSGKLWGALWFGEIMQSDCCSGHLLKTKDYSMRSSRIRIMGGEQFTVGMGRVWETKEVLCLKGREEMKRGQFSLGSGGVG